MRLLLIGLVLVVVSCSQDRSGQDLLQYVNGRQLLNLNGLTRDGRTLENPRIERISPDSISVGEQFFAKIYIADKKYELIDAYFDCKTVENAAVDTVVNTSNKLKDWMDVRIGLLLRMTRFLSGLSQVCQE